MDLYVLAAKHDQIDYPHGESVLDAMNEWVGRTRPALEHLEADGFVARTSTRQWRLTEAGAERARTLADERHLVPTDA
jgi:hypothetical protein